MLPYYAAKVKCIYIDPPYNTRSAFAHYDDSLEHFLWLAMMYPRLELLRELLSEDGSIWVSIDDSEGAYMRVIMDEIFGRTNFIACNVWQKRYSRENREAIGDVHEYVMTYAMNPTSFKKQRNKGKQSKPHSTVRHDCAPCFSIFTWRSKRMEEAQGVDLTARQRYWLEHIQACEASGNLMNSSSASGIVRMKSVIRAFGILVKKLGISDRMYQIAPP